MEKLRIIALSACSFLAFAFAVADAEENDSAFIRLPSSFPASRYTPQGYIDNPYHSMVFNRSGILRSVPPLGFGWRRESFKGEYGEGARNYVNYLSLLNFGIRINGEMFVTSDDLTKKGIELYSAYHTSRMMSYDWTYGGCRFRIQYFLPNEQTLAAIVELENTGDLPIGVGVNAVHTYRIGELKWWGSNGIAAAYDSVKDISIAKIWAYGDVFALGSSVRSSRHFYAASEQQAGEWMRSADRPFNRSASVIGRRPAISIHSYDIQLPSRGKRSLLICLSRGVNELWTRKELSSSLQNARQQLPVKLNEDDAFWSRCPKLEGDWDETWKRGWVYDFETLRMNVRRPIGIFKHPWDAMQVHSPRVVLGETCFDMMTLSYADPQLAKEVIYGTFADALAPNIPCVREDGSMNMISSDGSECGTAPMWGYPFKMIDAISALNRDSTWLVRLYPYLKSYIEWWLEHRSDAEGWLHCNNSWESGQDGSRRFLVAEHNEAAVADFVRTVDVEASMAEAMRIMAAMAVQIGSPSDSAMWKKRFEQRLRNTRSMFVDHWYRDVDARSGKPIILKDYFDVAMLSPFTCNVAPKEHIAAIRPMWKKFENGHEWPPGLFTLSEAAWNSGEILLASNAVAATADRVYKRTDSRDLLFFDSLYSYRVAGVANEFWPRKNIPAGGENYGWGATLPMNIIRSIIGYRESGSGRDDEFILAPALPKTLATTGKSYTIKNLHYRDTDFDVTYLVKTKARIEVTIRYTFHRPASVRLYDGEGKSVRVRYETTPSSKSVFEVENGTVVTVSMKY